MSRDCRAEVAAASDRADGAFAERPPGARAVRRRVRQLVARRTQHATRRCRSGRRAARAGAGSQHRSRRTDGPQSAEQADRPEAVRGTRASASSPTAAGTATRRPSNAALTPGCSADEESSGTRTAPAVSRTARPAPTGTIHGRAAGRRERPRSPCRGRARRRTPLLDPPALDPARAYPGSLRFGGIRSRSIPRESGDPRGVGAERLRHLRVDDGAAPRRPPRSWPRARDVSQPLLEQIGALVRAVAQKGDHVLGLAIGSSGGSPPRRDVSRAARLRRGLPRRSWWAASGCR